MSKKNILIISILVISIIGIYVFKNIDKKDMSNEIDIYSSNEHLPVLLDFGSTSCEPCLYMVPIIEKVKEDYKGKVIVKYIDVYKESKLTRQFKIRTIPTLIFIDSSGIIFYRHEGILEEEEIIQKLNEMGV